ncbi:MAG: GNAT family N-acetyltransferase [Ferruginibacter sp.]
MKIRKYHDSDINSIIDLLRLNTPDYFSPTEEKDLVDYLNNHSGNYYIIEVENKILGCGGFNLTDDAEIVRISWDIIHPQSQGKGIGSELTKFRIQRIKEIEGIKTISVRTSQLVYKFYERFGFEIKEIARNYWADGFDLYRMDCDINSIGRG